MSAVSLRGRYAAAFSVAVVLVVIVGLLTGAALAGCGGSASYTTGTENYSPPTAAYTSTTAAATATTTAGTEASGASVAQPGVAVIASESGQKIIGDAVMDIEVESGGFQIAFNNAALLADRYGGYIVSSQSTASGQDGKIDGGTIAVRVPVASFSAAIADAGKLGTIKNQRITTQDVTEEYLDLQARIINSQAKLDTYRKLFDKATSINDIVNVQQVLTEAQDELEQLKGRQRFLQEHTNYSTLTMNISEAGEKPVVTTTTTTDAPWGVGQAFGDAAHLFVKAVNAIIRALGIIVPVLVILAIIVYIAFLVWRRNARKQGRLAAKHSQVAAETRPAAEPQPTVAKPPVRSPSKPDVKE